jgi:hypothetical protein
MDSNRSETEDPRERKKAYSIEFKLKVVAEAKKLNSNNAASKLFHVDRKRVIEWRQNENHLQEVVYVNRPGTKRSPFF